VHGFKLVESWGGKISIKSKVGVGTIVEVALPKYNSAQENVGSAGVVDLGS
jgi:signal transduction histidine kinase